MVRAIVSPALKPVPFPDPIVGEPPTSLPFNAVQPADASADSHAKLISTKSEIPTRPRPTIRKLQKLIA